MASEIGSFFEQCALYKLTFYLCSYLTREYGICYSRCQTRWLRLWQTSTWKQARAVPVSRMHFSCCCQSFSWRFWKPSRSVDSLPPPHQLLTS